MFGYPEFLEAKRKELGLEKMDNAANAERMRQLYRLEASDIPEIPEH